MDQTLQQSRHISKYLLIVVSFLFLFACQSGSPRQSYEGEAKPNNEVAIFTVSGQYNLLSIDGVKFQKYALSKSAVVELLPGNHTFIIEYQDFIDTGGGEFEKITSKPLSATFSTEAGNRYEIAPLPELSVEQAQKYAEKPVIKIINTTNKESVQSSIKYNLYGKGLFTTLFGGSNPEPAPAIQAQAADKSVNKDGKALEMLKYWWGEADEKQQGNFQQWLKNQ